MVRWLIFSAVVVVVTALATVGSTFLVPSSPTDNVPPTGQDKPTGPPGRAVVEGGSLVHEFGFLPQQSGGSRDWKIENKGEGDLVCRLGDVSCSCTIPVLDKSEGGKQSIVVPPGGSTTLTVSWKTKTFSEGYHQHAELLVSNDPEHEKFVFEVKGTIRPPVVTNPQGTNVDFSRVTNEAPHTREITFLSFDRPTTKVTSVTSSNPALIGSEVVALTPDEASKAKIEAGTKVVLTLKPGGPLGVFHEEILVKTDHPLKPVMQFTATGRLDGPIALTPGEVRMVSVASKTGASQTIKMLVRGEKSTRFTVDKKPKDLDVTITPRGEVGSNAATYDLTVTVPPGLPSGTAIADELVLKTDHPHAAELKVRVTALVHGS